MARRSEINTIEKAGRVAYREAPIILWGDDESGYVNDVLNVVSSKIILAEVRLAPGQRFQASNVHKPIYDSDVCLYVLEGQYTVQLPDTGEVKVAEAGEMLFLRGPQWHFGYNFSSGVTRVLETISPPAAADRFADAICPSPIRGVDVIALEDFPATAAKAANLLRRIKPADALPAIIGTKSPLRLRIMASSPRVSLALVNLLPGQASEIVKFTSDATVYIESGRLTLRNITDTDAEDLEPGDAYFLPAGTEWQLRSHTGDPAFGQIALAGSFAKEIN